MTFLLIFRADQSDIASQAVAALASSANYYYWSRVADYWSNTAVQSPFLHCWSLSVEEQFYLVFPPLLWILYRYQRRFLRAAILFITLASFSYFLWDSRHDSLSTFYLLHSRAWELSAGCLLALLPMAPRTRYCSYLALAGLLLILAAYLLPGRPSLVTAFAVAGAAIVLHFARTGLAYTFSRQSPSRRLHRKNLPTPSISGTGRSSSSPPTSAGTSLPHPSSPPFSSSPSPPITS